MVLAFDALVDHAVICWHHIISTRSTMQAITRIVVTRRFAYPQVEALL